MAWFKMGRDLLGSTEWILYYFFYLDTGSSKEIRPVGRFGSIPSFP